MARSRFGRIFRLASREPSIPEDVNTEIETHLAETIQLLVAGGLSPEAAREEARRRFGDVAGFRREIETIDRSAGRRRRLGEALAGLAQDLALAARGLRRAPGYTGVVVGTLGLALGANATMFGIVDRLLLQPPAGFVAPALVSRIEAARLIEDHYESWRSISYPSFEGLARTAGFSQAAAFTEEILSFGLGAEARPLRATFATGQYFDLVGLRPIAGRLFGPADDEAAAPVAVLSYRFWQERFGGDPAAVGRTMLLNGYPIQIVGVTPAGFNGSELGPTDAWLPMGNETVVVQHGSNAWRTEKGMQWLTALARRRPEVPLDRALAEATVEYRRANAGWAKFEAEAKVGARPLSAYSEGAGSERIAGWLYGVTLIVLLIACANIANVVLARGLARRSETAVRQALGIPRRRLVRQLLTETALVTALGLGLGLVVAQWGGRLVRRFLLDGTSFAGETINLRVLAATAATGAVAALLASLWPLVRSARVDPARELHGKGRGESRSSGRARGLLLLAQTSLTTALVVMAGLFLRSIGTIKAIDLGFVPNDAIVASVNTSSLSDAESESFPRYRRAAGRIRARPGVTAVGLCQCAPLLNNRGGRIVIPGRDSRPRPPGGGPYYVAVSPG
ncbi:MAG: ABC transporter permease, partial [Gemmatimonadales bacterium]